jgi:hypothetical protein
MQIPLKRKYLVGGKSRYHSPGNGNSGNKRRHKLNDKQKQGLRPQVKRTLVVDGRTGHGTMQDYRG